MSSTYFNARVDTSDHGLSRPFKDPIANGFTDDCKWFLRRLQMVSQPFTMRWMNEASLYLQFQLHKLGLLNVRTDKNIMDLGQPMVLNLV